LSHVRWTFGLLGYGLIKFDLESLLDKIMGDYDRPPFEYRTYSQPPSILSTNVEARREELKHYCLSFGTEYIVPAGLGPVEMKITAAPHIYVNRGCDIICTMSLMYDNFWLYGVLPDLVNYAPLIRRLGWPKGMDTPPWDVFHDWYLDFSELQELICYVHSSDSKLIYSMYKEKSRVKLFLGKVASDLTAFSDENSKRALKYKASSIWDAIIQYIEYRYVAPERDEDDDEDDDEDEEEWEWEWNSHILTGRYAVIQLEA
jgi:hypothetical protein